MKINLPVSIKGHNVVYYLKDSLAWSLNTNLFSIMHIYYSRENTVLDFNFSLNSGFFLYGENHLK
jgi:hypothetical protein